MRSHRIIRSVGATVALLLGLTRPVAAQVSGPPFTFVAGTVADPNQVNTNFSTIYTSALNRTGGTMTGTLTSQQITPAADNTYDLAASAAMMRTLYTKTSIVLGQTGGNYTLTWANPGAARAISIPDPGGTDTFVFASMTQTLTNKTESSPVLSGTVTGTYTLGGTPTINSPNFTGTATGTLTCSRCIADAALSTNVPLLNAANTFTNLPQMFSLSANALQYARIDNQNVGATAYAAVILSTHGNSWGMREAGDGVGNSNTLDWCSDALGACSSKMSLATSGLLTVAGGLRSSNGSTSVPTGVATTLFTAPAAGRYELHAYSGDANFLAYAVAVCDGTNPGILLANASGTASFQLSITSCAFQLTQTSGVTKTVSWAVIRVPTT